MPAQCCNSSDTAMSTDLTFADAQARAWANKRAKGFNTTNVEREFCLLMTELGEAYDAWRKTAPPRRCSAGSSPRWGSGRCPCRRHRGRCASRSPTCTSSRSAWRRCSASTQARRSPRKWPSMRPASTSSCPVALTHGRGEPVATRARIDWMGAIRTPPGRQWRLAELAAGAAARPASAPLPAANARSRQEAQDR